MSLLDTLSGGANVVNFGSAALSLVGMGSALFKPKNPPPGIDGILFDIPLTDAVTYAAQITDHFTEENSAIQDHVSIEPVKITLTGKMSELVYTKYEALAFLSAVVDRLTPLGVLSPGQAAKAQQAIAAANQAMSVVDTVKKTYGTLSSVFSGQPAQNNQQHYFSQFEQLFLGRSIITVETPWKTFPNMIIENFNANQDEDNTYETTFTLSFKQMRFVGVSVNVGQLTGRIVQQQAPVTKQGDTGKGASTLIDMGAGKTLDAIGITK